jgi:hypothetical protein
VLLSAQITIKDDRRMGSSIDQQITHKVCGDTIQWNACQALRNAACYHILSMHLDRGLSSVPALHKKTLLNLRLCQPFGGSLAPSFGIGRGKCIWITANTMHCLSQFTELSHLYMFRAYQQPIIRR